MSEPAQTEQTAESEPLRKEEPPATKFPPPTPKAKKKSGGGGCLTLILLLAIVGGGGYYSYPYWEPQAKSLMAEHAPFLAAPLEKVENWTSIEDRLQALEQKAQAPADASPMDDLVKEHDQLRADLHAMMARIGELEKALSNVRDMIGTPVPLPTDGAELGAVRGALDSLTARLSSVEGAMASAGSREGDAAPDTAAALQALALRLESLEAAPKSPDLSAATERLSNENTQLRDTVNQIAARLDGIESLPAPAPVVVGSSQGQALILAIEQLRSAVAGSGAFGPQLETVAGMAGGDPKVVAQVNALAPFAASGVPTVEALRIQFSEQAADIVRAGMVAADGDWMDQTMNRVLSVVRVRRTTDNLSGEGADALVARAESALATGDLTTAVQVLGNLTGPGLQAAAPWLSAAQSRLTADSAGRALQGHAISLLTAKSEG
ncbi:COG4223 family protein [Magnetospira sp. QH-2]|uniref:COG4223 family protein n=1 Tax=Magnetospira sp. (strain QH-2) TaxID=1288970 RepID=UPI0003E811ED|nr:mitofilin family membrane protein [Magnetospira sp. QH-2]CCQ75374.1 protein of unknown function [Magnetospira sp. QH-2]